MARKKKDVKPAVVAPQPVESDSSESVDNCCESEE